MRLAADPFAQRGKYAGLADAGLARQQRDLSIALARVPPALHEQRRLVLAPDKGGHRLRPRRLETAHVLSLAHDRPNANGSVETLEHLWSQEFEFERSAQEPLCRLRDHDAAGIGQNLQPRREVRRVADDAALARFALAHQFADDDATGRDAGPNLQRRGAIMPERGDRVDQSQARARSALGIVLVSPGIAEIDQCAVTHELGDMAVETSGRGRHRALECTDQGGHVFWIEPRRQLRRTNEIAEHHGELATLGHVV